MPIGLAHLNSLVIVNKKNRQQSESIFHENQKLLRVLGTALLGTYTSSTCDRACSGGNHIIETLRTRVYNLAVGAYSLIGISLYDESLNLVRGIGEIANLLRLAKANKIKFEQWMGSDKSQRIKQFSPRKVRDMLDEKNLVMGQEWYSELCESYSHITPHTAPNNYDLKKNACGGIVQKDGALNALCQLMRVTISVALDLCQYSSLDDIYEELQVSIRLYGES